MYPVRPNWLMKKYFPSALWHIPTNEKKIFLTFDDGPVPEITPHVLSVLNAFQAKATFFCVGDNIEKHTAVFNEIIAEGHSIGNHSFSHLNGWNTDTKEYLEDVEKCNKILTVNYLSFNPDNSPLFRPPYGKMKRTQYASLKNQYSIIMWDVLSGDFDNNISPEKCLENAINNTRDGSIVIFHDNAKAKKNLYYALPEFLNYFSERGFTFCSLPYRR